MFFFQFLAQAGLFFVVPLYLSVCLGLSALETGARLLPLSVTLLIAAIGIPRCSRTSRPGSSSAAGSSLCSPEPLSSWARSTWTPGRRPFSSRCS